MGQRILTACDVCGIKKEMSVGAGLMTNNPDMIASCLNGEEAEAWKSLYSQRKVESFRASQKVFCCDHCRDLRCQLTVSATLTDGTEVTFGDKCAKCHGELQEVSLAAQHQICPVCGKGDLSWRQTGFWD